jgi:uncharacterized protein YbaP (TraB family)
MIRKLLLGAVAALALAGCAVSPAEAPGPALFVARDADSTLYLYGTIHLRKTGETWGSPAVEAALASADEIWTEMLISPDTEARAQALTMQVGLAPPGRPLSSWLSAEENERLRAAAERLGLPPQALEPMQPWLAGLTLSLLPMMKAGYDPQAGVDRAIDAFGDANGKTMRAFETAEQQIGCFANMSPEVQRQMLLEAIEESGRGAETLDRMSEAWERGDLRVLERMLNEDVANNYPEVYEVIIRRRNAAWMETIMQELDGSGVDFVAVGTAHLAGEDGLVEQLRARGVRVERVRAR